ncbi:methyltransferase domain-containing protein [Phormidium pseudopriestleyi FRX01]|uniref:Methyltransferase domain-containing protein n=1 Tax=Phormidium pseudopriestleyi FRX01 TaxID=1759528 RepID=A0ABS3FL65_9CYAN|nr:methyltransferase domain-containing protein [Phormidium pseudopriestleyi]MBO0347853.1 methyltransferase domain-containing protein [Phormidium pseudopriestleyi FRX01]
MSCPLCNENRTAPSWLGSTFYQGEEFTYIQCLSCNSLYCDPMPTDLVLEQMYGLNYGKNFGVDLVVEDPKSPQHVIEWLKKEKVGTFVDYGCGAGSLLQEAKKLNWQAIGVEFNQEVAKTVEQNTGAIIFNRNSVNQLQEPIADILHLGDAIEHLTQLNSQMPKILSLIKPGGLLLAQGPLENNTNLFTFTLSCLRSLHRRRTEMPPYHVILATAKGQKILFQQFGLEELEYSITEVSWPAPNRLSFSENLNPRSVALFLLRRCSQAFSALQPNSWGNRYFYAGRWKG